MSAPGDGGEAMSAPGDGGEAMSAPGAKGRPVMGAIFGLLLGIFVTLDLLLLGVFRIDNIAIYVVPLLGLLAGIGLAMWAPIRRQPSV